MKYLILSDIHSNHEALSAVMSHVQRKRWDKAVVLGDRTGVYFLPPNLLKSILDRAEETHIHDEWTKAKFATGKYKSSELYPTPKDPAMKNEYEEYKAKKMGKQ